ncbi:MAG TPA: PaaX family transcriptional regulator C-terminal domain-containing protein [Terrimesophilobacter sp.]|nr:PaaX family transcriptional regulator C-terminal domain-containing protein [Terrimesophilobacter sp.]
MTRLVAEPQHLLITLLGDYWWGRRELIPSAALVDLLAEFGATESSSRQAMRRLTNQGLLVQKKVGRTTSYGIPARISEAQSSRLRRAMSFGSDFTDWDGRWTVVSFSVPEKERGVRRLLRNGLRDMRFGLLHDAIWVTPHDRARQAGRLLDDLGVESAVVMRSELLPRAGGFSPFHDVFELDSLAEAYEEFIERHEPEIGRVHSGRVTPSEALVLRTELMNEWLSFRLKDPELPITALPQNWPRPHARKVFLAIYDGLGESAEVRFKHIVGLVAPELAEFASYHTSTSPEVVDEDRSDWV